MPSVKYANGEYYSEEEYDYDSDESDYMSTSSSVTEEVDYSVRTRQQDMQRWWELHGDAIAELFQLLKSNGQERFGRGFMQFADVEKFGEFIYKQSSP